jgi:ABC-type glycerol-3-phosphate transport system substrate-binding protein
LFTTLDHAITDIYVANVWCSGRDIIIRSTRNELYLFAESDAPPNSILRIAAYDAFLLNYIVGEFNAANADYKIVVDDYFYIEGGLLKLDAEILAGNAPDMFDFSYMSTEGYGIKGFLLDLYPLMDADPAFDRSDLMEPVLKSFETNGALYFAPMSFTMNGFVGLADVVGSERGWTLDEMLDIEARYNSGGFGGMARTDAAEFWLGAAADSFIDRETGICSFDSEEFTQILEYLATLPENPPSYSINDVFSGELPFYPIKNMMSLYELQTLDALFGDTAYTFKGVPTPRGASGMARSYRGFPVLGIAATSSEIDTAWSFVRFMYSEYDGFKSGYQVSETAQARLAESVRDKETAADGESNPRTTGMGTFIGLEPSLNDVLLYPVTAEQAARFGNVARSCDLIIDRDSTVMSIIREELTPFFAGGKSAAETARIIQSREQIYVNEQR